MRKRSEWADRTLPNVIRYIGVILIVYAALVDRGRNPGLIPAASLLVVFKSLLGGKNGG